MPERLGPLSTSDITATAVVVGALPGDPVASCQCTIRWWRLTLLFKRIAGRSTTNQEPHARGATIPNVITVNAISLVNEGRDEDASCWTGKP
jgi:hypothetical protein